jgi:hypothetical protein
MSETNEGSNSDAIRRALQLVTEAMDVLDGHGGPPDAVAHLSIAQDQLRRALNTNLKP